MKKRFRNENGQLATSMKEIRKQTRQEATEYYKVGGIYLNMSDNTEYVCIESNDILAHFHSFDDKHLYIAADSLGTFLPDVASEGMELIRVE